MARARHGWPFVGRSGELGALESAFEQARAGQFHCVLLFGEPGTGKSRLAGELLSRHSRNAIRLTARGYPFGGTTSFGLWIEALDRYVARLVANEIGAPSQVTPHQRLLLGLTQVMHELAAESPVIVLLDDIHLADTSSWEALGYLARNLLDSPILIVACARSAELQLVPTARLVMLGLEQEGVLTRVEVPPLGYEETEELAEALLDKRAPAALVDWLFEHSRGNPLFAIGLIRALLDEGVDLAAPALQRLPANVADQVMKRVPTLNTTSRTTLDVLAVLARPVHLQELVTITERSSARLYADLENLVRAGLVVDVEMDPELAYAVIHPLLQEALYQQIPRQRRWAIHRTLARALNKQGKLAEAASHYARCASVGEDEAINVLIAALKEAEERESPYEAMAVLEALLVLLPSGDRRWLRVLDATVWDAEWVLDYNAYVSSDTGFRAMREIERSLRSSPDPLRQAVVQERLAGFSVWDLTQAEVGLRSGREAQQVFERMGQRRLATMSEHLISWMIGVTGDLRGMEETARRVITRAESDSDLPVTMHGLGALGWSLLRQGRFTEADQALQRANQIAREGAKPYRLAWGLSTLAFERALEGDLVAAKEALTQANVARPGAADSRLSASISLLAGDAAAAFSTVRHEASPTVTIPNAQHAWALIFGTVAAARIGRTEDAEAMINATSVYAGHIGLGWEWFRLWALGSLQREQGDTGAALSSLRRAAQGLRSMESLAMSAIIFADAAEVACDRHDVAALLEIVDALRALAERIDRDLYRAIATLATAQLQLARDQTRAAQTALQAARTLGRLGYRGMEARALEIRGRALVDSDRGQAAEAMRRVVEISSEGGTTRPREAALRLLDHLGRPGRRAAKSLQGQQALTPRERQILRYVADGLTAREIARRLHIGERTVETHTENAYAKLGVDSRLDLVRRASKLEL